MPFTFPATDAPLNYGASRFVYVGSDTDNTGRWVGDGFPGFSVPEFAPGLLTPTSITASAGLSSNSPDIFLRNGPWGQRTTASDTNVWTNTDDDTIGGWIVATPLDPAGEQFTGSGSQSSSLLVYPRSVNVPDSPVSGATGTSYFDAETAVGADAFSAFNLFEGSTDVTNAASANKDFLAASIVNRNVSADQKPATWFFSDAGHNVSSSGDWANIDRVEFTLSSNANTSLYLEEKRGDSFVTERGSLLSTGYWALAGNSLVGSDNPISANQWRVRVYGLTVTATPG